MAGKLSFSIAVNLLTENFKKGTNNVRNAFRSMQAQILTFAAAMGFAGVSLSNFFTQLVQVARETSKAVTALKNVSGSTAQFTSNLQFTTELAKKYGAYVNDLTANFAKFSVAASISGMAMEDQRKLFESLSRAAAGFGMSADESNGMFLAVTQMMGKGKIQAEELRGQLGERLPIAMQAMAKAAGTTVAGLDKLMKAGKLLSADVLPKFAAALNEMLPNVDTDNIETSLNRLKNVFQEFTEKTGIQGAYKSMIDGLTGFVDYAKDKMSMLVTFISALIAGRLLTNVAKYFQAENGHLNATVRKHELAELQKTAATQKRMNAEKMLSATQRDYDDVVNGQRLASEVQLEKTKSTLRRAKSAEKKAILAAELAAEKGAAIQSMGFWKRSSSVIVSSAKKAGMALKAMWSTVGPMALITVIAGVIAKLVNMYTEAKRIRNIFNDYKKEAFNISPPAEKAQLEALQKIAEDTNRSIKERKDAWAELASQMNVVQKKNETELDYHKRINDEIAKRIKLLENTAKAEFYATRKIEAEDKFKKIQKELGIQNMDPGGTDYLMQQISSYAKTGSKKPQIDGLQRYYNEIWNTNGKFTDGYEDKLIEMSGYWQIMADATKEMEAATVGLLSNKPTLTPAGSEPDDKKTPLQKEEEKYAASLKALTYKLANRAIAEEEYKKQLSDLNKTTYDTLSGMLTTDEAAKNKTYQTVKGGFSADPSPLDEVQREYKAEMDTYTRQLERGVLTEDEVNKARLTLIEKILSQVAGMDNIGQEGIDLIKSLTTEADGLREKVFKRPEEKKYDSTFDYKKTDADILGGKLSVAKENLDSLKEAYKEAGKEMGNELNAAMNNVTSLEDALKIAEVKQDIDDLSKQLSDGIYSGVKDIASSADRLVSAFSSLRDVMSDEDATAWERIMAVWSAMVNTVDAFMSIVKTIETLTQLTEKLGMAKKAEAAIDTAVTTTKVANAAIGAGADIAASEVKKTTASENVAASTAEGAADAGKGAAKLPFPWNIVAIGGAIAAAIAAFSVIPKFANGGILTGSTTGDKNIARFNGGEMFLNGRQQATLFQIANGKGIKTNGEGQLSGRLIAEGSTLVAVIDSYAKKQRRGK